MELTKVIITIPKDKYEYIQELEHGSTDYATSRMLYHAVKKGTLLDDIKAEINQLPLVLLAGNDHIDKDSVMQILDTIGKGDKE